MEKFFDFPVTQMVDCLGEVAFFEGSRLIQDDKTWSRCVCEKGGAAFKKFCWDFVACESFAVGFTNSPMRSRFVARAHNQR